MKIKNKISDEIKENKVKMVKLSAINQIVEGIIEEVPGEKNKKILANEAVIYYKTLMICEDKGIDKAMKYFHGTHSEDEYQEFTRIQNY